MLQFVEMQKFFSGAGSHNATWNKDLLAREVLFEIPEQLVSYMRAKNFKPPGKIDSRRNYTAPQLPYNISV